MIYIIQDVINKSIKHYYQCMKLEKGSIQYRTHTQGGAWLPWVSDRSDYAGILGKNIDGIQMKISGLSGYNVKYRAYVGGRWLPWVVGLEDYAGIYGQPISGIQVSIISPSYPGGGSTTFSISGYLISMKVEDRVICIENNNNIKLLYNKYGYSGMLSVAVNALAKYKSLTGKYLYIDADSVTKYVARVLNRPITSLIAAGIIEHTQPIDCGEDAVAKLVDFK